MSIDTDTILALTQELANVSLPKDLQKTPIITSTKVKCVPDLDQVVLTVSLRRVHTARDLLDNLYHGAAHYLCARNRESSLMRNGQHTKAFAEAYEYIIKNGNQSIPETKATLRRLNTELQRLNNTHARRAYDRVTFVCPAEACRHTMTIRRTAAEKTVLICRRHDREMRERNV